MPIKRHRAGITSNLLPRSFLHSCECSCETSSTQIQSISNSACGPWVRAVLAAHCPLPRTAHRSRNVAAALLLTIAVAAHQALPLSVISSAMRRSSNAQSPADTSTYSVERLRVCCVGLRRPNRREGRTVDVFSAIRSRNADNSTDRRHQRRSVLLCDEPADEFVMMAD